MVSNDLYTKWDFTLLSPSRVLCPWYQLVVWLTQSDKLPLNIFLILSICHTFEKFMSYIRWDDWVNNDEPAFLLKNSIKRMKIVLFLPLSFRGNEPMYSAWVVPLFTSLPGMLKINQWSTSNFFLSSWTVGSGSTINKVKRLSGSASSQTTMSGGWATYKKIIEFVILLTMWLRSECTRENHTRLMTKIPHCNLEGKSRDFISCRVKRSWKQLFVSI